MYSDSKGVKGKDLEDFIVGLYSGRYLHILDKIVLGLKLENLRACKRINQQWSEIVEYYLKSDIPRLKKNIMKIRWNIIADATIVSKQIFQFGKFILEKTELVLNSLTFSYLNFYLFPLFLRSKWKQHIVKKLGLL